MDKGQLWFCLLGFGFTTVVWKVGEIFDEPLSKEARGVFSGFCKGVAIVTGAVVVSNVIDAAFGSKGQVQGSDTSTKPVQSQAN